MSDQPAIPFRLLRAGLRAASKVSASVVDRVLRNGAASGPARLPSFRRAPTGPLEVVFGGRVVRASSGATLLEAAVQGGVDLRSYCGGNCSCGTCRVEILAGADNLSRPEPMEKLVLGMTAERRGDRLACQAQVLGRVEVRIPEWF